MFSIAPNHASMVRRPYPP